MTIEQRMGEDDKKLDDRKNNGDAAARAKKGVQYNERFNVPEQTEKEEAESHGNMEVENLADDKEIERRKKQP
jgi:hypothetical protein